MVSVVQRAAASEIAGGAMAPELVALLSRAEVLEALALQDEVDLTRQDEEAAELNAQYRSVVTPVPPSVRAAKHMHAVVATFDETTRKVDANSVAFTAVIFNPVSQRLVELGDVAARRLEAEGRAHKQGELALWGEFMECAFPLPVSLTDPLHHGPWQQRAGERSMQEARWRKCWQAFIAQKPEHLRHWLWESDGDASLSCGSLAEGEGALWLTSARRLAEVAAKEAQRPKMTWERMHARMTKQRKRQNAEERSRAAALREQVRMYLEAGNFADDDEQEEEEEEVSLIWRGYRSEEPLEVYRSVRRGWVVAQQSLYGEGPPVIAEDICTPEQQDVIELRARRPASFWDPEQIRARAVKHIANIWDPERVLTAFLEKKQPELLEREEALQRWHKRLAADREHVAMLWEQRSAEGAEVTVWPQDGKWQPGWKVGLLHRVLGPLKRRAAELLIGRAIRRGDVPEVRSLLERGGFGPRLGGESLSRACALPVRSLKPDVLPTASGDFGGEGMPILISQMSGVETMFRVDPEVSVGQVVEAFVVAAGKDPCAKHWVTFVTADGQVLKDLTEKFGPKVGDCASPCMLTAMVMDAGSVPAAQMVRALVKFYSGDRFTEEMVRAVNAGNIGAMLVLLESGGDASATLRSVFDGTNMARADWPTRERAMSALLRHGANPGEIIKRVSSSGDHRRRLLLGAHTAKCHLVEMLKESRGRLWPEVLVARPEVAGDALLFDELLQGDSADPDDHLPYAEAEVLDSQEVLSRAMSIDRRAVRFLRSPDDALMLEAIQSDASTVELLEDMQWSEDLAAQIASLGLGSPVAALFPTHIWTQSLLQRFVHERAIRFLEWAPEAALRTCTGLRDILLEDAAAEAHRLCDSLSVARSEVAASHSEWLRICEPTLLKDAEAKAKMISENIESLKSDALLILEPTLLQYGKAQEGIQDLNMVHIHEVRALCNPPLHVKKTAQVLCLLFKPGFKATSGTSGDGMSYFLHAKQIFADRKFMSNMIDFDKDNLEEVTVAKLREFCSEEIFQPAQVRKASFACEKVCVWVHGLLAYHDAAVLLKPVREKIEALGAALEPEARFMDIRRDRARKARHEEADCRAAVLEHLDSVERLAQRCLARRFFCDRRASQLELLRQADLAEVEVMALAQALWTSTRSEAEAAAGATLRAEAEQKLMTLNQQRSQGLPVLLHRSDSFLPHAVLGMMYILVCMFTTGVAAPQCVRGSGGKLCDLPLFGWTYQPEFFRRLTSMRADMFSTAVLQGLRRVRMVSPCSRSSGCRLWFLQRPDVAEVVVQLCRWIRGILNQVSAMKWGFCTSELPEWNCFADDDMSNHATVVSSHDRLSSMAHVAFQASEVTARKRLERCAAESDEVAKPGGDSIRDIMLGGGRLGDDDQDQDLAEYRAATTVALSTAARQVDACITAAQASLYQEDMKAGLAQQDIAAYSAAAHPSCVAAMCRAEATAALCEHLESEAAAWKMCVSRAARLRKAFADRALDATNFTSDDLATISAAVEACGTGPTLAWPELARLVQGLGFREDEAEKLLSGLGFAPSGGEVMISDFLGRL